MIDAQEAYDVLRKEYPVSTVVDCLDFGDFFGFTLAPVGKNNGDLFCTGSSMYSVNKKTKKISMYDILSDVDSFLSAKKVNIKDIMDVKLSEVRLN